MICKPVLLVSFLNEHELIFFYTVKWVLSFNRLLEQGEID